METAPTIQRRSTECRHVVGTATKFVVTQTTPDRWAVDLVDMQGAIIRPVMGVGTTRAAALRSAQIDLRYWAQALESMLEAA